MRKMSLSCVSIPFRADTGFEHHHRQGGGLALPRVSIPFRADTGFEQKVKDPEKELTELFQSLSGLTLGLNFRTTI